VTVEDPLSRHAVPDRLADIVLERFDGLWILNYALIEPFVPAVLHVRIARD